MFFYTNRLKKKQYVANVEKLSKKDSINVEKYLKTAENGNYVTTTEGYIKDSVNFQKNCQICRKIPPKIITPKSLRIMFRAPTCTNVFQTTKTKSKPQTIISTQSTMLFRLLNILKISTSNLKTSYINMKMIRRGCMEDH